MKKVLESQACTAVDYILPKKDQQVKMVKTNQVHKEVRAWQRNFPPPHESRRAGSDITDEKH